MSDASHAKARALQEEGTLNPFPEKVGDPKFQDGDFFDPRDAVQVKYEMLRRVLVDHTPVIQATAEYGISRPTFYQAKANFQDVGIAGLVPGKRGPRGPHKLQEVVLAFLRCHHTPGSPIRARELTKLVLMEFDLEIHPRTIERALSVKKTPK